MGSSFPSTERLEFTTIKRFAHWIDHLKAVRWIRQCGERWVLQMTCMTRLHDLHRNTSFKFCGKFKWVGTIVEFGADFKLTMWRWQRHMLVIVVSPDQCSDSSYCESTKNVTVVLTQRFDKSVNRQRGKHVVLYHLLLAYNKTQGKAVEWK